jgi:hypothetical protein
MLLQSVPSIPEVVADAAAQISVHGIPWWATTFLTTATVTKWCVVRLLRAVLPDDSADRLRLWLALLDHRGKRRSSARGG